MPRDFDEVDGGGLLSESQHALDTGNQIKAHPVDKGTLFTGRVEDVIFFRLSAAGLRIFAADRSGGRVIAADG